MDIMDILDKSFYWHIITLAKMKLNIKEISKTIQKSNYKIKGKFYENKNID